jgi:hypothetical protein
MLLQRIVLASPLPADHTHLHRIFQFVIQRQDRAVGIATGYRLEDLGVGVRVPVGSRILFSPRRSDRLWGPSNLLSNGHQASFPWSKAAGA